MGVGLVASGKVHGGRICLPGPSPWQWGLSESLSPMPFSVESALRKRRGGSCWSFASDRPDYQASPGVNQKMNFILASKCITLDSVAVQGFPQWLSGKESACNAGDAGDVDSIPGLGRSPGGGNGNPFQYSCLKNPMDRGAWWAIIQSVAKSETRLSDRVHICTQLQKELSAF